jgi:hypothetical protein
MPSLPPFSLSITQASIHTIINQPRNNYLAEQIPASEPQPQASNAWSRKALNIISMVERDIHQASEPLSFLDGHAPDHPTLQKHLDNAVKVVESSGRSLAAVKHKNDVVQQRKAQVMAILRNLDSRVSQVGGFLPPRRPDTAPILVDAGERALDIRLT